MWCGVCVCVCVCVWAIPLRYTRTTGMQLHMSPTGTCCSHLLVEVCDSFTSFQFSSLFKATSVLHLFSHRLFTRDEICLSIHSPQQSAVSHTADSTRVGGRNLLNTTSAQHGAGHSGGLGPAALDLFSGQFHDVERGGLELGVLHGGPQHQAVIGQSAAEVGLVHALWVHVDEGVEHFDAGVVPGQGPVQRQPPIQCRYSSNHTHAHIGRIRGK
mmetsp:Transcript_7401/g.12437  ORF Transcript_7401/g.12437 Transcript_7401/m.12437 type:complete len:214 (-) Transcript_7401:779-1420(-)